MKIFITFFHLSDLIESEAHRKLTTLFVDSHIEFAERSYLIKFARYVLEHARNLKKMAAFVHAVWARSLRRSKSISNASVVCTEKRIHPPSGWQPGDDLRTSGSTYFVKEYARVTRSLFTP